MRYAGFWIRVCAVLIDGIIMIAPSLVVTWVSAQLMGITVADMSTLEGDSPASIKTAYGMNQLLYGTVLLAYHTFFDGGKWQGTPGKRLIGIYICRPDGSPIGYGRAIGRYFAAFLSWITVGIGYFMAGFTREKTALHDLVAGTRVVYGRR